LDVQDFLGEGEKVIQEDREVRLTDRKILILRRRSYTAIPYEQISSLEYERSVLWGLVLLGLIFVGISVYTDLSGIKLASTDPTTSFLIFTIFGIICAALGFFLPVPTFLVRTTSGWHYPIRTRNTEFLAALVKLSGRSFQNPRASV
jgi:Na+/proline symporter